MLKQNQIKKDHFTSCIGIGTNIYKNAYKKIWKNKCQTVRKVTLGEANRTGDRKKVI